MLCGFLFYTTKCPDIVHVINVSDVLVKHGSMILVAFVIGQTSDLWVTTGRMIILYILDSLDS